MGIGGPIRRRYGTSGVTTYVSRAEATDYRVELINKDVLTRGETQEAGS